MRMKELLDHLVERESSVPYFYCDHNHLVTIAIGFLVEQQHAPDAAGVRLARRLATRGDVAFVDLKGMPASTDDVEQDWLRVKSYGRTHGNAGFLQYKKVAQLRIGEASIAAITRTIVTRFLDDLYLKRPFVIHYDPRVAMALVDVRYNPASVSLYGGRGPVQEMWEAMNPQSSRFDLTRVLNLFEQIWANRGVDRYAMRHWLRMQWMREGLDASGGQLAPRSA